MSLKGSLMGKHNELRKGDHLFISRRFRIGFLLTFALVPGYLLAQSVTSQITGLVTDATGSTIPDAEIKAVNKQTGIEATQRSKTDGSFQFLNLPASSYDVTVSKVGFQKYETRSIVLALNQNYRLPVTLEVGKMSQSVEVEANAAQVETSTTQLGTIIDSRQIVDLPLNGRDWTQLEQLSPGVVSGSDRFGSNGANGNSFATNGSQSQQNAFLINGIDSNDLPLNTPAIIPSPDAIGEFNFITSTINPEYGRNSGGVLNAVIKSGTNQFHGDAFEFYRDTFLNSRTLYEQVKPVFHQNQFGGTLGGPIWKDHTFFFISYQGTRFRQPQAGQGQTTVFSQDQRNGLFPDIAKSTAASPIPLVGSNGSVYAAGTPYNQIFPTGQIPLSDFSPISQKLLAYVPAANSPGGIYSFNPITTGSQDQGIIRVDHTFNQSNSIWFTGFFQHSPTTDTLPFTGSSLPGFGDANILSAKQFSFDYTHTFSATTVNEFRLGYLRSNDDYVEPQQAISPSSLGFQNIVPQNQAAQGIPYMSILGLFNLGFSTNGPQPRIDETYQLTDSVSKVAGNHTMKFGFDGKRYSVNNPFYGNNNGNYSFGAAGPYSTGDAGADFLLGIPDSYTQGSGGYIDARTYEYYGYAQDSWKISQNFTVNYGTGYQVDTPMVNQHFGQEALNCFRPGQQSTIFPTAPLGLLFPGDKTCTKSGYYNHYDHFGPRFGFAYSPGSDAKTSVRGGFGIYFNRSEEELSLQNLGAVPFSITSHGAGGSGAANASPSFANPYTDIATGQTTANPFPFTPATKGSPVNFSPYEPLTINVINPNFTSPYAMNFNLNVQRQLPGNLILQIGYVGAQGRHLELTYEGNPISPAGTAACAADPTCIQDRSTQHNTYPSHALYAPGNIFASVGTQATVGVSSYNSMQVSLRKTLSHGLSFLASYTWSHSIDDTSGFENSGFGSRANDPYNFALSRGDSAFDARQRLVISYDYEVPHLSRYWNNVLTRTTLDGWHLAGITTLQTGFPINIADTAYRSLQCDSYSYYGCWDTANYVSPNQILNPRNSSLTNNTKAGSSTSNNYYYFNPNTFAVEPIGTLGNSGRNSFHGPGQNNTDMTLSKRVYVTHDEKRYIDLRLEAYNVFNHTQFQIQSTTISFSGTGVNGDINSSNFGRVLSALPGRTVQLGAKFYF